MKNLITSIIILLSFTSFGQELKIKDGTWNMYYGTKNTIGIEMNVVKNNNITIGGGLLFRISSEANGVHYTTMGPNRFPQEIYEKKNGTNFGMYGMLGYNIDKLTIISKLGFASKVNYYNAYDRTGILSPTGYYYTTTSDGLSGLIGVSFIYKVDRVSPYIGIDNVNGLSVGVSFSFVK